MVSLVGSKSSVSIEEIKEKILEDREKAPSDIENLGGLYLFFSFDLVNSTKYKSVNSSNWPITFSKFYELVYSGISKRIENSRVWKYIGDELVLYLRVVRKEEVYTCLPKVAEVLRDVTGGIHRIDVNSKPLLSVKAAVWSASVDYVEPQELTDNINPKFKNIVFKQQTLNGAVMIDFLGPDIDAGFRASKFSSRNRLVVGADLAYILYRERSNADDVENKLRIVSYEVLNGVWENRRYPIVWYEMSWGNVDNLFLYDEKFDNHIVHKIINGEAEDIKNIKNIYKDICRDKEVDEIWDESLLNVNVDDGDFLQNQYENLEVHCAVVIINENNKFMAAKRANSKVRFPGKWEFGCGQIVNNESFEECIARSYREDFGIEFSAQNEMVPIKTYLIEKNGNKKIPGIIFVTRVTGPVTCEGQTAKHDEIAWFDLDDHDFPDPKDAVPNFRETVVRAYAIKKALLETT